MEFQPENPAQRLELAYLYADGTKKDIEELAKTALNIPHDGGSVISARAAVVHAADLNVLVQKLDGSPVVPSVVVDFPDGRNGLAAKIEEIKFAKDWGAVEEADVVINLRWVKERKKDVVLTELKTLKRFMKRIKVICQVPYLWTYDREAIPWLMDILEEAKVFGLKDWTTRKNFSKEVDVRLETRLEYTRHLSERIEKNGHSFLLKIAGAVDAFNAPRFVEAGANLLGISYPKAASVYQALL